MLCDEHFKSTSFEKEKRLAKFSMPENHFDKVSELPTLLHELQSRKKVLDSHSTNVASAN